MYFFARNYSFVSIISIIIYTLKINKLTTKSKINWKKNIQSSQKTDIGQEVQE